MVICITIISMVRVSTGADTPVDDAVKSDASSWSIRIKAEAQVPGEKIYLRDVAVVSGAGDMKERIEGISLGTAPRPGDVKVLAGKWVASVIQNNRWVSPKAKITAPDCVSVQRGFQSVSRERLKALLYNDVASKAKGAEFKIRRFKVRGAKNFPLGKLRLQMLDRGRKNIMGRINLTLAVEVDGEEFARIILSAWIDRYERVVCARRSISRHTVLTEDDLCLELMNISKGPANLLTSIEDAAGKRVKRSIRSGSYLGRNMLEAPPLIYKGDRVRLVAQTGPLTVSTLGIAQSQGGKGAQVKVANIKSGQIVMGRVTDASTVAVLF